MLCLVATHADEVVMAYWPLEPANGTTVPAGTPVVFSAEESGQALTFSVASSPALLSSPDIDSGTGSQASAFDSFTSTKATASPRTIYWTASFTVTPDGCEGPSTFTTSVRTLTVVASEAELAAAKMRHEEEAAKKQSEEKAAEGAARKREEEAAAAGSVALDAVIALNVVNSREAAVNLTCADVATCTGELTLTASATAGKGKTRHNKTEHIGTARFSIAAGEDATIKVALDKTGRSLLRAAHGHLSATLTILRTTPLPSRLQTQSVYLEQQKATDQK
jgi:hypothetical protein